MAPTIKIGDTIPKGVFSYIPYTNELENISACGIPIQITTDEWKGKKIVLFAVPGAFTPTCHANHLPPYVAKYPEFKAKGVDLVAVLAANDPFVMSGWIRFIGVKEQLVALSDPNATWASALGLSADLAPRLTGLRTSRFAIVIEDLVVKYLGVETAPGVTVSGADAVLAAL